MLLLTDDPIDGLRLKRKLELYQPCVVLSLTNTPKKASTHWLILCMIDVFDQDAKKKVISALNHYRFNPEVPVIFIVDTSRFDSLCLAKEIGATAIIPREAPVEDFMSILKSCRKSYIDAIYKKLPARQSRSSADVKLVGGAITELFQSARTQKSISIRRLEEGAENLIQSVKSTDLKEWIDIVRSYDDATYQHCLLVAGLVATFSMRLGLSLNTQHWLAQAAIIHDTERRKYLSIF